MYVFCYSWLMSYKQGMAFQIWMQNWQNDWHKNMHEIDAECAIGEAFTKFTFGQ